MRLATSYKAMPRGLGSQTGRVTPRVTLNWTSFDDPRSESIRSTPRSRSSWRLAMDNASPVQVVVTQFTHCPPLMTPTLKVQSDVVMSSISISLRAISRIAERPSPGRDPAWLGRPVASRLKRAMA